MQEYKLEEVTDKQDFSNRGIMYLCNFVTEGLEGRQPRPDTIQVRAAEKQDAIGVPLCFLEENSRAFAVDSH